MAEKIVWIGGYPFIEGINAPPDTTSADPLEQSLLDDVQWENEMKSRGIHGWSLVQLFINRLKGGNDATNSK